MACKEGKTILIDAKDYYEIIHRSVNDQIKKDKYKWHDIRKVPDELPAYGVDVFVCVCYRGRKTYNRTWLEADGWRNATSVKKRYYSEGSVIAWRYIEPVED